jgi:hypothetical protein
VSTSRTTVNNPRMNTPGSTVATNGPNTSGTWAVKPMPTNALDSDNKYSDARDAASLTVVLAAD